MEFRLFDKPDYAAGRPGDAAWYKDRAVSDHINEPGHRQRLLQASELVQDVLHDTNEATISDWAAGNGGLLHEFKKLTLDAWGYDMSPLAVAYGRDKYGVDLTELDVTEVRPARRAGNVVVLTEFLEHLEEPHKLVHQILRLYADTQFIVASVPGFEDPRNPYEYHLWCWHGDSFAKMFERIGWKIEQHFFRPDCGTQFLVARR